MATKAKIAELAGVSPATVSNFYNGKDKMAEETKRKILEAACIDKQIKSFILILALKISNKI